MTWFIVPIYKQCISVHFPEDNNGGKNVHAQYADNYIASAVEHKLLLHWNEVKSELKKLKDKYVMIKGATMTTWVVLKVKQNE